MRFLVCILKDKRLVSGGWDGLIKVYNKSYEPQIQIQNNKRILTLCVLKNGELLSSSFDFNINVWIINENDYELIHTLTEHTSYITKVIELEDGRICSCSSDKTIKIWDNKTYQSITTLQGHTDWVRSIIEMSDYIISAGSSDGLRIWNKLTYQFNKQIKNVRCCSWNALEKLNNNTVLSGDKNELFIVDIKSSEINQFTNYTFGGINCLKVIKNDLVLIGNEFGEIYYYNPLSNKIISKFKAHNDKITCLIVNEDNQLISCSKDTTIKIYELIIP